MRAALLTAACLAASAASARPAVQAPSPVEPYYRFVDAIAAGRIDEALDTFDAEATVVADPVCPIEWPCVGRREIAERYLPTLRSRVMAVPLFVQSFDGRQLFTRGDPVPAASPGPSAGWRVNHRIELHAGRIRSLIAEPATEVVPSGASGSSR